MATFKVGQRVRIVRSRWAFRVGAQATIIALHRSTWRTDGRTGDAWDLDVDGVGRIGVHGHQIAYFSDELAPLTDPKADAFLDSIRKLKPLHEEPKVKRELGTLVGTVGGQR